MAVDEIVQQLETLDESSHRPHVAIVALPVELIERVWNAKVDSKATIEKDDSGGSDAPDFRGMLKAKAMGLCFPIQIAWEDVFDETAKIPLKSERAARERSKIKRGELGTCSRRSTTREQAAFRGGGCRRMVNSRLAISASVSIARWADSSTGGRDELIRDALSAYKNHHKHYPARVIVLKTSQFREEEAEGIFEAIDEAGPELRDLVWVQESYSVKVLRDGNYPVMRGTFVELDGKGLLYTNGSIPYYGTYPGLYDPRPLLLCPYEGSDSTIAQIASEVLSLTKVNWNSTQMNQKLPIPIRAARAVGEVLKYVTDQKVSSDYARYI
jgi:hypothetical protein